MGSEPGNVRRMNILHVARYPTPITGFMSQIMVTAPLLLTQDSSGQMSDKTQGKRQEKGASEM